MDSLTPEVIRSESAPTTVAGRYVQRNSTEMFSVATAAKGLTISSITDM